MSSPAPPAPGMPSTYCLGAALVWLLVLLLVLVLYLQGADGRAMALTVGVAVPLAGLVAEICHGSRLAAVVAQVKTLLLS